LAAGGRRRFPADDHGVRAAAVVQVQGTGSPGNEYRVVAGAGVQVRVVIEVGRVGGVVGAAGGPGPDVEEGQGRRRGHRGHPRDRPRGQAGQAGGGQGGGVGSRVVVVHDVQVGRAVAGDVHGAVDVGQRAAAADVDAVIAVRVVHKQAAG